MLHYANFPRISFGIIVLNGEPFTKYCLRQLYPHAYEIIVVEGGSRKAIGEAPEGHSTDGTLEALCEFKTREDPENKVQIITRDGFWTEKDEQSQAYAQVATGDYLWQVDIDEFYRHDDIEIVRDLLREQSDLSGMSFRQLTFWASPYYVADSFYLRLDFPEVRRLFRWGPGFRYLTHRPPTVADEAGKDLSQQTWLSADKTVRLGLKMFHYSLLFPHQVIQKCNYYAKPGQDPTKGHLSGIDQWATDCYLRLGNPFRVHNVYTSLSWIRRYAGSHPEEVYRLWDDVTRGKINTPLRQTEDVEYLLSSKWYLVATSLLSVWANIFRIPLFNFWWNVWGFANARAKRIWKKAPVSQIVRHVGRY